MSGSILHRIANGRTDLIFNHLADGNPADSTDAEGVSLMQWCSYYGDVTGIRYLLSQGASLTLLGDNLDLNGAAFHGHWRLCEFLLENGADANHRLSDTGESALHASLCKENSLSHHQVVKVLLAAGANPNCTTIGGIETGCFMRDCRTKGETPLHRAAAFASEAAIQLLLDAGAKIEAQDMHGDSPLAWASWYLRDASVLRKLCYGDFRIHPNHIGMAANLIGKPQ